MSRMKILSRPVAVSEIRDEDMDKILYNANAKDRIHRLDVMQLRKFRHNTR
ncbi:MAG: hypothetical protein ABI354_00255 [Candidatus Saccharimonadales bacterium]